MYHFYFNYIMSFSLRQVKLDNKKAPAGQATQGAIFLYVTKKERLKTANTARSRGKVF